MVNNFFIILRNIVISMRPKQWLKNLVVFTALFFSKNIFNKTLFFDTLSVFFLFCLLSGATYIINDIFDRREDILHPQKKLRPIAKGNLSIKTAIIFSAFFFLISAIFGFYLSFNLGLIIIVYSLLNLIYSAWLKKIVIIDALVIAFGFLLRIFAGMTLISFPLSKWLILSILSLSLFLTFSKRRHEIFLIRENAEFHRLTLKKYNHCFLDFLIAITVLSSLFFYFLYTVKTAKNEYLDANNLIFTIPFVAFGILRYLYLIYKKREGGTPVEIFLKDKPLLINTFLWIIIVGVIIYIK